MKMIELRKRTLKTFASTALLLCVLGSMSPDAALGQPAPEPGLPEIPRTAGVLPTPAADAPPGAGALDGDGGVGRFGGYATTRSAPYYSAENRTYGYHATSAQSAVIIQSSQSDPQNVDALQEDLNVMSLLLQKKIESAFGENSPTYRMGIPLLLRSGQRGIETLYLDGFGAVLTVNVNFPLVPPPASRAKEKDKTTGSDDWDKARKELYGPRETEEPETAYSTSALPYSAEQVGALKRALLGSLKNAANIRGLKSDEWILVAVFGTEGVDANPAAAGSTAGGGGGIGGTTGQPGLPGNAPGTPLTSASWAVRSGGLRTGRGTILTVRVRKSEAELFAKGNLSLDQFEQKATITTYLGPTPHGNSPLWRNASFPGQYPVAPMTR